MTAPPIDALPRRSYDLLIAFAERLGRDLGDALVEVVIYGGVAKGRFEEDVSDLNVLVVLREASLEALDEVGAAAGVVQREVAMELLIVAESDLPECVEVFATKFCDIQRHHILLRGRDVVAALVIAPERVVRQARREIVNVKLRVRQAYLRRAGRMETLEAVIDRGTKTVRVNLEALLALPPGQVNPEPLRLALKGLDAPAGDATVETRTAAFLDHVQEALQALGPL